MKAGKFIFNPQDSHVNDPKVWEHKTYNAKTASFEPGSGIALFSKKISFPKKTESAVLRVSALGIYNFFINGKRVGDLELTPGWTQYDKRVFEIEYDVSDYLKKTGNYLVARVSTGWWSGRISFGRFGSKSCALAAELEVVYADGTKDLFATDETWNTAIGGRIRRADIWDGEYFDATLPDDTSDPKAVKWEKASVVTDYEGVICPYFGAPVKVREELSLRPQSAVIQKGARKNGTDFGEAIEKKRAIGQNCEVLKVKKGECLLLDFGQNFTGRPYFEIVAEKGTVIEGFVGEMLNDSGSRERGNDGPKNSIYIENYRSALARIKYGSAGGAQSYAPSHTFYGLRYLELSADGDFEVRKVVGQVIGSVCREVGAFSCSNEEVNKLYSNLLWGQRSNYLYVPTDCPQRDERLGWTGDTEIFCHAAAYNADIYEFMRKWTTDCRDAQTNGFYPSVCPSVRSSSEGGAAWADAGVIVPYKMWLMYGNKEIVEENYDAMDAYMTALSAFGMRGPKERYGDWLCYEDTDKSYISLCYYAYDTRLMIAFSKILGKSYKVKKYKELLSKIKESFAERYVRDGEITEKSQTAYLLALHFGLVDGELFDKTKALLVKKIEDNDYTLSTGFVGTGILAQTLSELGLDDLCYDLLLQVKDPSWLYSVRQGATTIWERWNSYTKNKGFGQVTMNSFNHYAYGAVSEWLFSGVAGIAADPENPGFEHFILAPTPDTRAFIPENEERVTHAEARYESKYGVIESRWAMENGAYKFSFVIPEGTSATVKLPLLKGDFEVNGLAYTSDKLGKTENGRVVFDLGAGKYTVKVSY